MRSSTAFPPSRRGDAVRRPRREGDRRGAAAPARLTGLHAAPAALAWLLLATVGGLPAWADAGGPPAPLAAQTALPPWTADQAWSWWRSAPLPLGANFLPSTSASPLEMWRQESFDARTIDRELGFAQGAGLNTVRIFLHDLAYAEDPEGFLTRLDATLAMADRHGIRPILVLFDSCWDPDPVAGPQRAPLPGVHNSAWTQSPGRRALEDPASRPRLRSYVEHVVGRFAKDPRILMWDVWNEPDNINAGSYEARESPRKSALVAALLPDVFDWVRGRRPAQPATSGLWQGADWSDPSALSLVAQIQIARSDILSFHDYGWPETFAERIRQLQSYGRPVVCTEFLARDLGSTIDEDLPIATRADVGVLVWGLVAGRSQTNLPWDSWSRPYLAGPPTVWHQDLLRADGSPYRRREIDLLRAAAAAPRGDQGLK